MLISLVFRLATRNSQVPLRNLNVWWVRKLHKQHYEKVNIVGDWLVIALAAVPLGRVQLRLRGGVWPRSALAVLYRLKDRARIIKLSAKYQGRVQTGWTYFLYRKGNHFNVGKLILVTNTWAWNVLLSWACWLRTVDNLDQRHWFYFPKELWF